MGNAEFLTDAQLGDEDLGFVSEILTAAQRGGELTRRLLSFARRSNLAPEVIDVNAAVTEIEPLQRRSVPENVRIEISQAPGLWSANVDKGLLESAVLNVVINARDAIDGTGVITIETANVKIGAGDTDDSGEALEPGPYVMLAVTDTGHGIAPEALPSIFQPFFTTKWPDKGTRLGLSMVYGFARQSGGTVRAVSAPDEGTTIRIYLRATDTASPAAPDDQSQASGEGEAEIVLVVEDQDSVRAVTSNLLRRAGYRVLGAASGDEAMALLLATQPRIDLMITDIIMPGALQGPSLARKVSTLMCRRSSCPATRTRRHATAAPSSRAIPA